MYGELHKWLILGYNLTHVSSIIDDRVFGYSTDFIIAVPSAINEEDYTLYDAYNLSREYGRALNITLLGSWSKINRLEIILRDSRFLRRSNSHGLVLRAAFFKVLHFHF